MPTELLIGSVDESAELDHFERRTLPIFLGTPFVALNCLGSLNHQVPKFPRCGEKPELGRSSLVPRLRLHGRWMEMMNRGDLDGCGLALAPVPC